MMNQNVLTCLTCCRYIACTRHEKILSRNQRGRIGRKPRRHPQCISDGCICAQVALPQDSRRTLPGTSGASEAWPRRRHAPSPFWTLASAWRGTQGILSTQQAIETSAWHAASLIRPDRHKASLGKARAAQKRGTWRAHAVGEQSDDLFLASQSTPFPSVDHGEYVVSVSPACAVTSIPPKKKKKVEETEIYGQTHFFPVTVIPTQSSLEHAL